MPVLSGTKFTGTEASFPSRSYPLPLNELAAVSQRPLAKSIQSAMWMNDGQDVCWWCNSMHNLIEVKRVSQRCYCHCTSVSLAVSDFLQLLNHKWTSIYEQLMELTMQPCLDLSLKPPTKIFRQKQRRGQSCPETMATLYHPNTKNGECLYIFNLKKYLRDWNTGQFLLVT